jgi:hypothetical protein
MERAAARAMSGAISPDDVSADYVIPSVFNRSVAPAVAPVAQTTGSARRSVPPGPPVPPFSCRAGEAQYRPTVRPSGSRSISNAAGCLPSPGIVCISPQSATSQPAPV